jgi:hypothetical protein
MERAHELEFLQKEQRAVHEAWKVILPKNT